MNEEIILEMSTPYVKDSAMTYGDFDKIFSFLSLREQYAVTDILYKNGIDLVDNHVEDEQVVFDVDKEIITAEDFEEDFEILYDDTIFKDKNISDTYNGNSSFDKTIKQSNEILCYLIQQGNSQAAQDLCIKNRLLVEKYAAAYKKIFNTRMDIEDLEQVGFLGLLKAAQMFDIQQGNAFSTYAVYWVKQSISREIIDNGYLIRIPVHLMERISKVLSVCKSISGLDVPFTEQVKQIAKELDLTEEKVIECFVLKNCYLSCTSLDALVNEESDSVLGDFIPDEEAISVEQIAINKELRKELESVLQTLDERDRNIIKMRYGWDDNNPKTLEEIGTIFHITRERVRQIEVRAMRKLRNPMRSRKLRNFLEE